LADQEALEELIREINLGERDRAEMNLRPESFAIYWLLNRDATPNAEWIARQMEYVFKNYPHWHTSEARERDVRRAFNGVLLKENAQANKEARETKEIGELTALVEQIMKIYGQAGELV
jgi:type I restriction enzyme R subunit